MIAGGKDKGIPYDDLGEALATKTKFIVLIGKTAPLIQKALSDYVKKTGTGKDIKTVVCTNYEEAVLTAKQHAAPGDVVLLSNASTSFDMFDNFEQRGNLFKSIVNSL